MSYHKKPHQLARGQADVFCRSPSGYSHWVEDRGRIYSQSKPSNLTDKEAGSLRTMYPAEWREHILEFLLHHTPSAWNKPITQQAFIDDVQAGLTTNDAINAEKDACRRGGVVLTEYWSGDGTSYFKLHSPTGLSADRETPVTSKPEKDKRTGKYFVIYSLRF